MSTPITEPPGASVRHPPAPEGRTIYAVGDIHGRLDLLEKIQRRIDEDKKGLGATRVSEIYLGDYIDRGPDSAGVVSRLIARGRSVEAIFLRGNHEQVLLNFLDGEPCLEDWRAFGGIPTLLSYQLAPDLLGREVLAETVHAAFVRRLPAEHRQFYAATSSYCDAKPYLFVHAGIRPGVKLEEQSLVDLLTIRKGFLDYAGDLGRVVVHGHTPVMAPEMRPNRINVDTGAFATNKLTCLKIDAAGPRLLT